MQSVGGGGRTPEVAAAPLRRNVVANYLGKLWSIASIYLFVPLYVKILGVEAYGVIAFHSALLGVLLIADAGLSSAFAREMARRTGDEAYLRTALRSLEAVYFGIAAGCTLVIGLCSGWIAEHWLRPTATLTPSILQTCIALMGVSSTIQVAMSLYNGGFMGADQHTRANAFQVAFSICRSGLVVAPIYFFQDLRVYFGWQAIVSVFFIMQMRRSMWKILKGRQGAQVDAQAIKTIWQFAAGMLGIAVISAVNTQLDKLVVSKFLSLHDLARFSIASLLAQLPSMATLPLAVSLLPRLTRWASAVDTPTLSTTYLRYSFIITSIASAAGGIVLLFPAELVRLWTGNDMLSSGIETTVSLLVVGHVLLAMQFMPYHLALAFGHSQTNLRIGTVFLIVTPGLLVFMTRSHGIQGAAVPWLVMNAVAAVLLGKILTSKFLPNHTTAWFVKCALLPIAACMPVGIAVKWGGSGGWLEPFSWPVQATVAVLGMAACCSAAFRVAFAKVNPVRSTRPA